MNLTGEQQAVLNSKVPRLAVAAGPGSGKTKTVVELLKQMQPAELSRTAVMTFTIAAAAELRERLGETKPGFVGTLHSWCANLLRSQGDMIEIPSPFTVISAFESDSVLDHVLRDGLRSAGSVSKADVVANISWERYLLGQYESKSQVDVLASMYLMRMWSSSRLDYDALLELSLFLLKKDNTMAPKILIVDEVQDSSKIDWDIYDAMKPERIIAVGDPDQSIYEFRGAVPLLFTAWAVEKAELLTLEKNFRSDRAICAAANALIQGGSGRLAKHTTPVSKKIGRLAMTPFASDKAQDEAIVKWALEASEKKDPSWAILCRTNREVLHVRNLLTEASVTTDDTIELGVLNPLAVFLNVVQDPFNDNNAMRAVQVFRKDLKQADVTQLSILARSDGVPMSNLLLQLIPELKAAPEIRERPLHLASYAAIDMTAPRFQTFLALPEIISKLPPESTIDDLCLAVTGFDSEPTKALRTVRTIHRAKGLEWDDVLVPSINEGQFPPAKAERLEEARRLLFVAITRARHRFTGFYDEANPSRFIEEMER